MNIRPIRDGDEAPLADLWTRCGLVRPWNDPFSDIAFARATAQTEIFVGERDSAIIASVMCGHDGHRGWVYYLAVSPDCQGRDLGRAMMTQAEDHLRALDVPKLELMIRETNAKVVQFYEALDYKTEPVIVMSRWLKEPPVAQDD
ncbi:MAG: GNAT family acetyltransferase [Rhodospirillaceae bacterium]|nr:GNAT family acetyltransferase [Rhodospirillaceae bacterium]MDD9914745.1 GNAT family acetyltransferase [Rhodospirillaceae bacterium]MDD9929901.1 GNAT family acetyltransferase [Rhodospirillaceae bacterium]